MTAAETVAAAFVLFQVSIAHHRSIEEITGKSREASLVRARREAARELKETYGFSLVNIGKALGFRHHTTILSLIEGREEEES